MKIRPLIFGIASYFPVINRYGAKGTGGTDSARYCYSVWLRHLVMAKRNGLGPFPRVVAELGPGDSLGIGLAALLSGCDRYFALDVVDHANARSNLEIFDELVELFRAQIDPVDTADLLSDNMANLQLGGSALTEADLQRCQELMQRQALTAVGIHGRVRPWHKPLTRRLDVAAILDGVETWR